MLGLNIIFHAAAALALIWLLADSLRLRRRLRAGQFLLRTLNHGGGPSRYVDWPGDFLEQLSFLTQTPHSGLESLRQRQAKPVRMAAGPWMAAVAQWGLAGIAVVPGSPGQVQVALRRLPDDPRPLARQLEAALNIGYTVSIVTQSKTTPAPAGSAAEG